MTPQDDIVDMPDELTTLKARADLLGIAYHPSIKLDKLKEKVNAAVSTPTESAAPVEKSESEIRAQHMADASRLVRVRVTCMNPNKKEWTGEIYTVGNSVVGTFKKYVPFNADDGWHIPNIIYEHMVARECQVFATVRDVRGNAYRKGRLIKEFSIEVLPPLNATELQDLAQRQAMAHAID